MSSAEIILHFDLEKPGMYRLSWHYEGGGLEEVWTGEITSNQIEIEIVP